MLMSVLMGVMTVILMLSVPTLLVASPVPVTRDTLEMAVPAKVRSTTDIFTLVTNRPCHIIDFDECASPDDSNCNTYATCTNTPGGFTCTCNQGYTGDGVACVGKCSISFL